MEIIVEYFNKVMNHPFKWFLIIFAAVVIVYLFTLCLPFRRKKAKVSEVTEKEEKALEEETNVEEEKEAEALVEEEKTEEALAEEEKEAEALTEDEKAEEALVEEEKRKVLGKWIIKKKSEEDYILTLVANNGEIILASESHANVAGAKNSLQTLIKNIENDNFQLYCDKNDQYFFKLKDGANKLLAMGQIYSSKKSALNSINSVKRFYLAELSEEVVEDVLYSRYQPKDFDLSNVKDAYRGKWIIKKVEESFVAELRASNGEVILVTERYSSINSVYSAIETLKKNSFEGNFVIDCDKNKNYFYRLRNANKLTLAIGETYAKLSSVVSSIESVRKFCETAEIVEKLEDDKEEK